MDSMDIKDDISCVEFDELGVRPINLIDDMSDLDFDNASHGFYGKDEKIEFYSIANGKKLLSSEDDFNISDDDESNYEIDPETGEKIFRGLLVSPSPSFSSSNTHWIEEYLTNIESSKLVSSTLSTNQLLPNSDLLFESIPLNNDQTDTNWLFKYISVDESANNMFPDQYLSDPLNDKSLSQTTTSPIFIPSPNRNSPDSLMNLFSVGGDDEHSTSSNSNNSRRHRLYSSVKSDSNTRDSQITFDGTLIEAKLEKIEYDEYATTPRFVRRTSTRSNIQGQQDEEILQRYNIPLTVYDITQSSTEEYNRRLACLHNLTPEQLHIIKDIRRRGKNKIAAQNCRKRKAINVETLVEEVDELKRLKHELEERKKSFQQEIATTRHQYEYLHRQVLPDRQLPPAIIVK